MEHPFVSELSLCSFYNQENFSLELEKLRIELRHAQGMHAVAQSENIDASRKVMSILLWPETLLASLSLLNPFPLSCL